MKPCRVALVGGGRWARVYARVLSNNPDFVRSATIVSPRNADGMRRWIATEGLPYEAAAAQDPIGFDAAIIANAAADHESWAERFLKARVPVLIEKPFATSAAGATHLIDLAQAQGVYLAAGLVFKFARYVDRFAALLPNQSRIRSVSVTWTDPSDESRYGERKSYDPSVPVPADALPHVVSILDALLPANQIACRSVAVGQAGAQVGIELVLNGKQCVVRLARNSDKRVRLIEVATDRQRYALDFSVEPGQIVLNGESQSGDPDWGNEPSPLTRLVQGFLNALSGGTRDDRLDARLGLLVCSVTDQALRLYDAALPAWLRKMSDRGTLDQRDLDYAIAEFGSASSDPDRPSVDQLIAALERRADSR